MHQIAPFKKIFSGSGASRRAIHPASGMHISPILSPPCLKMDLRPWFEHSLNCNQKVIGVLIPTLASFQLSSVQTVKQHNRLALKVPRDM